MNRVKTVSKKVVGETTVVMHRLGSTYQIDCWTEGGRCDLVDRLEFDPREVPGATRARIAAGRFKQVVDTLR